jgi:beta-N-acetylhexosaminidase
MIDVAGTTLTAEERWRLAHPLVGGVILFSRNFESAAQLAALCAEIHALREPPLLIAVDHEGGRVQRFREGFVRLPAMRRLGEAWVRDPAAAMAQAGAIGYLLAAELRAHGVDLSFTPVLDLDWGNSGVIGDRAFHDDPEVVIALAGALIGGLHAAGMAACGKHFPGHGWVRADSHLALPVDERPLAELDRDLLPYRRLKLDAVMPAHVIFPQVDARPAGFSPVWLARLRKEFGFRGAIFSDDLSMEGAACAGDFVGRAEAAWAAGCDVLIVCNSPDGVGEILDRWQPAPDPLRAARIAGLLPQQAAPTMQALATDGAYLAGCTAAACLECGAVA